MSRIPVAEQARKAFTKLEKENPTINAPTITNGSVVELESLKRRLKRACPIHFSHPTEMDNEPTVEVARSIK